ncbi:MAG: DUF3794 domain-containing protein [Bacilli bacterium]|nr:DUF3794 domain-containing protein [Bacilli bacterium]
MRCNCSSNFNYQVAGLCDIPDFNLDTNVNSNWTEISVPEILTIPCAKPDIESIDKIYINSKITTTKIIKTPTSPKDGTTLIANPEGLKLTGWKLLVEGFLCQTLVYTADECEQSVHSAHFNMPFSTYIVLPEDTDLNDKFNVRVCIEYVFTKRLTPRTIFKNVTVYLQADKLS